MVSDYQETKKTEEVVEAFETQFSYKKATKDFIKSFGTGLFQPNDRHEEYTWEDKRKRDIVGGVSAAMSEVAEEYGIEKDIQYDVEGEEIQKFSYEDENTGDALEVTMQCSDKYMVPENEDSRFKQTYPGIRVMVEATDESLVDAYDEKLNEIKEELSGKFA